MGRTFVENEGGYYSAGLAEERGCATGLSGGLHGILMPCYLEFGARIMKFIIIVCFVFSLIMCVYLSQPPAVYAYLDPGTGSYIFQILIAGLLGGLFALKLFWGKIMIFFRRHSNNSENTPPDEESSPPKKNE